jgi:hypothetical protein
MQACTGAGVARMARLRMGLSPRQELRSQCHDDFRGHSAYPLPPEFLTVPVRERAQPSRNVADAQYGGDWLTLTASTSRYDGRPNRRRELLTLAL